MTFQHVCNFCVRRAMKATDLRISGLSVSIKRKGATGVSNVYNGNVVETLMNQIQMYDSSFLLQLRKNPQDCLSNPTKMAQVSMLESRNLRRILRNV